MAERRLARAAPWLIALAAILPYSTALVCGFAFDDFQQIVNNSHTQSVFPPWKFFMVDVWSGAVDSLLLGEDYQSGIYRPIYLFTCALQLAIHGPKPLPFHAVNVLLHAGVCLTLWGMIRRLGAGDVTALITALLFATFPIHTEAVTGVVGRAEVLAALFAAAAVFTWLGPSGAESPPRWGRVSAATVLAAAAMFSKENAMVAPLLVVLADLHVNGRPSRSRIARWCVLFLSVALFLTLRGIVFGSPIWKPATVVLDNPLVEASSWERLLAAPVILFRYIARTLVPVTLCADHSLNSFPLVPVPKASLLAGLALALALALVAWCVPLWRRAVVLGTVGLLFTCALILNWPLISTITFAERLFYTPSFFVALFVGAGLASLSRRSTSVALGVVIAVLLLYAARTALRNLDWRSNLTLARATVETVPDSARAQAWWANEMLTVARVREEHGDPEGAEEARRASAAAVARALEIFPEFYHVLVVQAHIEGLEGNWEEAARLLETAKPHIPYPPKVAEFEAEVRRHLAEQPDS
jgi:hypothetical protein